MNKLITKGSALALIGFIVTLIDGSFAVFIANKVGMIVGTDNVGYVYSIANIALLFLIPFLGRLICHFRKTSIILFLISIFTIGFSFLFLEDTWIYAPLLSLVVYIVSLYIFLFINDLFVEMYTTNEETGRVRGRYLSMLNLGWVIAPLITGYVLDIFDYKILYTLYILLILLVGVLFFFFFRKDNSIPYCGMPFKETIKTIRTTPDVIRILFLQFILWFFYAFNWSFLIIYFHQNLLISWHYIGLILAIYNLPYLLFDYTFGRIVDRYRGEEYLFLNIGLLIGAFGMFLTYLYTGVNIWLWVLIVFITRMGIALFELMISTHFFRMVDAKDVNQISMYNSFLVCGGLMCGVFGSIVLKFIELREFILVIALVLGFCLLVSSRVRKVTTV